MNLWLADSLVRRVKAHPKPHQEIPPASASPKKTKTAKPTASSAHAATATAPPVKQRPQLLRAVSPFRSTPAIDYFSLQPPYKPATDRPPTPPTPTPAGRKRQRQRVTRTPRSLAAIDADDDEDESEEESCDDTEPTQYPPESSIHRWWEYLDGDGPLLNKTGHPDYVPERGQQPYFKGGRRYWF